MRDITFEKAIEEREALQRLGHTVLFLPDSSTKPWDAVTGCEPGCSFRNGIPVSVTFQAEVDGLTFKWFFDLEHREANGSSLFHVDTDGCRGVMKLLAPAARERFRDWLLSTAKAVRAKATEYQDAANDQLIVAASLIDLCTAEASA
jgi:hypothetical protein